MYTCAFAKIKDHHHAQEAKGHHQPSIPYSGFFMQQLCYEAASMAANLTGNINKHNMIFVHLLSKNR